MTRSILTIAFLTVVSFSSTVQAQWFAYSYNKTLFVTNDEVGEEMINISTELRQGGLTTMITHVNLLTGVEESRFVAASSFDRILFIGDEDADFVTNNTEVASFLYGGDGDDILVGGGNIDNIYGERGCDSLLGMAGSDYLDPGMDDVEDVVDGGSGGDVVIRYFLRNPRLPKYIAGGYKQLFQSFDAGNDPNDVERVHRQTYYEFLDWNGPGN